MIKENYEKNKKEVGLYTYSLTFEELKAINEKIQEIDSKKQSLSNKIGSFIMQKKGEINMRKWTKETALTYIKHAKEKGLTYWSAVDYLKHHKTMHSIV